MPTSSGCQAGRTSTLALVRGFPLRCHSGGRPGCEAESSSSLPCHMNVFSGPRAPAAPAASTRERWGRSSSSRSWRERRHFVTVVPPVKGAGEGPRRPREWAAWGFWLQCGAVRREPPTCSQLCGTWTTQLGPDPSIDQMGEEQAASPPTAPLMFLNVG